MALLLAIETTTRNCSVALFRDNNLLQIIEQLTDKYLHAEQLNIFIESILIKSNNSLKELDAIVLSKGPGSYTGLRIGTSSAKGLCYSLDIPLISISTLKAMAFGVINKKDCKFFCPMIDARRMEVFSAIFDLNNKEVREIRADIVDHSTYSDFLKDKVLFFGDGSSKCKEIINSDNAFFINEVYPSAKDLGVLGFKKFTDRDFEDLAYFEPYYLKDFVAGKKN